MQIELSALGPSIFERYKALGIVPSGHPLELLDRMHKAITLLHDHSILTRAETNRARHRLLKSAKLVAAELETKR